MRRRDFIAGPIADALGPLEKSSGRLMAISIDMQGTVRLREVFGTSFKAFGRHVVAFSILSSIAHIIVPTFSYFVFTHFPVFVSFLWGDKVLSVADFLCVLIAYGAIIYDVLQDLVGRPVPQIARPPRLVQASLRSHDWIVESIPKAVVMAARRLSPLVGVWVAGWVLIRLVTVLPVDPEFHGFLVAWMYWLVTGMFFEVAPICIAEQVGISAALSRYLFLTKGYRWQIFIAILLVGFADLAMSIIWAAGSAPLTPAGGEGWAVFIMRYALSDGISFVLGAFNAVMAAVFYDRLRLAEDGVHIAKIFD